MGRNVAPIRVGLFEPTAGCTDDYLNILYREGRGNGTIEVHQWQGLRPRWFLRRKVKDDLLHLNWPAYYYAGRTPFQFLKRLALYTLFLLIVRVRGTKIVWTAHNLYPHDVHFPRLEWLGRVLTLGFASAVIAHDKGMLRAVQKEFHLRRPGYVVPHPSYVGIYRDTVTKEQARVRLGIPEDAFVFLAFGSVQRYKGIEKIIAAFCRTKRDRDRLVIAGAPYPAGYGQEVARLAAGNPQILSHLRLIPDIDVQDFFKASNVVVLAGSGLYSSAVGMVAFSFGRPIIASRNCAPECALETATDTVSHRDHREHRDSRSQNAGPDAPKPSASVISVPSVAAVVYDVSHENALEQAMEEARTRFREDRAEEIRRSIAEFSPDKVSQRFADVLVAVSGRAGNGRGNVTSM